MITSKTVDLVLPSKDITLHYWQTIDKLCEPLRKFGITFFNYLKTYNDGSVADLNNAPAMSEHFYYKSDLFQQFSPITDGVSFEQGFILDSSLNEQDFFEIMRNDFDIDHVIFLIEKQPDATVFWQFGTQAGNHKILNFYLNNLEFLKSFVIYFSKKAKEFIKLSDENTYKVNLIDCKPIELLYPYDLSEISKTLQELKINEADFRGLTTQEQKIINLSLYGKTAKEIARELKISHRTVEMHIGNAKKKLNCTRLSQVFSKIPDFRFRT